MIGFDYAIDLIRKSISPLEKTEVNLKDSLNLILSEDCVSDIDIPPFDNSAMDGYAIKCEDVANIPSKLEIACDLPAGKVYDKELKRGCAVRIMTGAPIPKGVDAVVMQENTQPDGKHIIILKKPKVGENIRRAGEDIKKGKILLKKGDLINSAEIGILASMGKSKVKVVRCPKIGIISTGDEIIPIEKVPKKGEIRNSNSYVLYALVTQYGAIPIDFGIIKDNIDILRKKMLTYIDKVDMLITTGGVSVGDYDLVKQAIESIGETVFWKVKIKPGKPVLFGKISNKPVFGLPGNPVSVMITFNQFVLEAIAVLLGKGKVERKYAEAILEEDIYEKGDRVTFIRGILEDKSGFYYVRTTGPQGSGILSSMHLANCLIIIPESKTHIKKGEKATIQFL